MFPELKKAIFSLMMKRFNPQGRDVTPFIYPPSKKKHFVVRVVTEMVKE